MYESNIGRGRAESNIFHTCRRSNIFRVLPEISHPILTLLCSKNLTKNLLSKCMLFIHFDNEFLVRTNYKTSNKTTASFLYTSEYKQWSQNNTGNHKWKPSKFFLKVLYLNIG